jgi:small multidrug resistance pump
MAYGFLLFAIVFEVAGTLLLPATQNFTRPLPTAATVAAYAAAFYLLTHVLKAVPIGVAYATWAGMGIFLIAAFGFFVYRQALPWPALTGMGLIVTGVVLVNLYAKTH